MQFLLVFVSVLCLINCVQSSHTRVRVIGKVFFKLNSLKERNVFPCTIHVAEGENVYMQLTKLPKEIVDCQVVLPDSEQSFTLSANFQEDRISYWNSEGKGNECGVKIKNVTVKDQGRYRLKALGADNDLIQGVGIVSVTGVKSIPKHIELMEGEKNVTVSLVGANDAEYCEINMPTKEKFFKENCSVNFEEIKKSYSGNWKIKAGIRGKLEEIQIHSEMDVIGKNFSVGVQHLQNLKTAMHCNLPQMLPNASNLEIIFCRFKRTEDNAGFNLNDGIGNNNYRYYGKGLKHGECGILIEKLKSKDEGTWKCSVGINNTETDTFEIFESLLTIAKVSRINKRDLATNTPGNHAEVVAQFGNLLSINCAADIRLKYCWFLHPNGTVFNPIPGAKHLNTSYWFSPNKQLLTGQCGLTIKEANFGDQGIWTCNMGQLDSIGMDIVSKIHVRISSSSLAALDKKVSGEIGKPVTLKCISLLSDKKLDFCRFTTPGGSAFKIQEEITEDKAIDNQYFYNGTRIIYGDCQVTITELQEKHIGKWTCTGLSNLIIGTDDIMLELIKGGLSVASISKIVGFATIILLVLGFVIMYLTKKYGSYVLDMQNEEQNQAENVNEEIELGNVEARDN